MKLSLLFCKNILKFFKKTIDKTKALWYNVQVVRKTNAGMAQSVEHVIGNDEVISSILITSSKSTFALQACFFVSILQKTALATEFR